MSIFKACDIRGRYGSELTAPVAYQLGRAVGAELAGRSVVVGGDVRPSTAGLKPPLIDGLVVAGCHVLDLGTLPTPAFYFAKDLLGAAGGIMVTGSHNPPGDNGFKLCLGPWPVTETELARVAERMAGNDLPARAGGSVETRDVLPAYRASILDRFPDNSPLRLVLDAGNGCYSQIAPALLRALGHTVIELFCEPDGTFPNRSPNPAVAANLSALTAAVVAYGAQLGVAYDGDGDRVVFVDELGQVIDSDRSIVLLARDLLMRRSPDSPYTNEVIFDIKCSSIVPEQVRAAGGQPVMEKSGHVFIKTALLRRRALFGGEISGHMFFGELGGDDGLFATAVMLRMLAGTDRSLASLAAAIPRYPITPDLRLPCPPERAAALVEAACAAFVGDPTCEFSMLDGVRLTWPDGWALIRSSVTEPLITLRFEAHSVERLRHIQAVLADRVPGIGELLEA
jgi:phosphomannomutase / phosphoglucomutase